MVNVVAATVSIIATLAVMWHVWGDQIRAYLKWVIAQYREHDEETARLNRMWEIGYG